MMEILDYNIIQPYVTKFLWMIGLIFFDVIGGILVSWLINKNFQWEKIPAFLEKYVPYIFGWFSFLFFSFMPVEFSNDIQQGISIAENTVYLTIMLGIGSSLLGHLAKFGIGTNTLAKLGIGNGSSYKNLGKNLG